MGLAPGVVWLFAFGAATGAMNGVLNVTTGALVMGNVAPQERGRVAAVLGGVVSGTQLAAYAAGGALADPLGPRSVFVLAGSLAVLAPLLAGRQLLRAAAARHKTDSETAVATA
jgi:MFS family permease